VLHRTLVYRQKKLDDGQHRGHQRRQVDHQQASQDQHPLSSEADGRTLADYRSLQAPTGRQTGVWQDALDLIITGDSSLSHSCIGQAPPSYSLVRSSHQHYVALSVRS